MFRAYLAMVVAVVAIAVVGGGWLTLGRVDPLLALPGMGWAASILVLLHPRADRTIASVATLLLLLIFAVTCSLLANRLPMVQLLLTGFGSWIAVTTALFLWTRLRRITAKGWGRRAAAAVMAIGLGVLVQWLSWPAVQWMYDPARVGDRSLSVDVLTALPLQSPAGLTDQLAGMAAPDAPVLLSLRQHANVRLIDRVAADRSPAGPLLLLAHPRALPPDQLVAIDAWIRNGGGAVILADGLLSWAPERPIGDPANPPLTSMLGPLLAHWGLELDAPSGLQERHLSVQDMGHKVTMVSPGQLRRVRGGCRVIHQGKMADCRIGQGRAIIVADADLLNQASWLPAVPGDGHGTEANWSASNPHWLLARLDNLAGVSRRPALARPVWVH
ncbi:hypothetical protein GV829_13415 [Sphingomonas lacunae]|uniref:ABC-type uncharacterized transport system domain-containing protein n=1 Tax=Sphingomonas lacunae TaxID=2698828 RepID=A0A6M4AY57_9SPHN|nr:hypothetical protein [Sphingomonas lacunae]QJQ33312.1 hypothetical protein GV829_13415 [Sphingomonas lacunae]